MTNNVGAEKANNTKKKVCIGSTVSFSLWDACQDAAIHPFHTNQLSERRVE